MSTPQDPYNQQDSSYNPYANATGDQGTNPYGQDGSQAGYDQAGYGQQGYNQNGYGADQAQYGQQSYGQNQYGQNQYGQQPYGAYGQDQYGQQYQQQCQQPYGAYGQQPFVQPAVGQKSKIVAGLLAIFLGSFGIHNFYLGYTGKAITQLLLTVLSVGALALVSAIWAFIEGIMILVSKPGTPSHRDARGFELQD